MNLQYISDSKGKPTGVFIPIKDWNKIKEKYDGLEQDLDKDWYELLSKQDKKAIEIGVEQADNGNTIPHKKVMQSVKAKIKNLKNQ